MLELIGCAMSLYSPSADFLLGKFAFRNQDQVKDMEEFILNGIEQLLPLYGKLEC